MIKQITGRKKIKPGKVTSRDMNDDSENLIILQINYVRSCICPLLNIEVSSFGELDFHCNMSANE